MQRHLPSSVDVEPLSRDSELFLNETETLIPPNEKEVKSLLLELKSLPGLTTLAHTQDLQVYENQLESVIKAMSRLLLTAKGPNKGWLLNSNALSRICGLLRMPQNFLMDPTVFPLLQHVLDILNHILQPLPSQTTSGYSSSERNSATKDSGVQTPLWEGKMLSSSEICFDRVIDLIIEHTQNGETLIYLFELRDMYIRCDCFQLFRMLYEYSSHSPDSVSERTKRNHFTIGTELPLSMPSNIDLNPLTKTQQKLSAVLLSHPKSLAAIIDTLQGATADFVRNEALSLLIALTEHHQEMQDIVLFQGCIETLCGILTEEMGMLSRYWQHSDGLDTSSLILPFVSRNSLIFIRNLMQNPHCVKYLREAGFITFLCKMILSVLTVADELILHVNKPDRIFSFNTEDFHTSAISEALDLLIDIASPFVISPSKIDTSVTSDSLPSVDQFQSAPSLPASTSASTVLFQEELKASRRAFVQNDFLEFASVS
ncbi:hypothetical protein IE077_004059, partial [Cardiosporidium cionae]